MHVRLFSSFLDKFPLIFFLACLFLRADATLAITKTPITLDDTKLWAADLNAHSNLNINVDRSVVRWLNYYLRSKAGRNFISDSMRRKVKIDKIIFGKIESMNLPRELIAIPMVESGFADFKKRRNQNSPVGIWQFDARTARKFHLVVNAKIDERRLVPQSTAAALQLLKHLHRTFGNWQLALAAYNQGEGRVKKILAHSQTRDAIALASSGRLNDYVAKMTAAMLAIRQLKAI